MGKMRKHGKILIGLIVLGVFWGSSWALAGEPFPTKAITLVVNWPPGGSTDIIARTYLEIASKVLGQPVVVVNKGGAAGCVGIPEALNAKPDGYTLLGCGASVLSKCILTPGANWKLEDVQPILGNAMNTFAIVVPPNAPWKNFKQWVAYVKENPGFKFGGPGSTGVPSLLMDWISKKEGIKTIQVPFKGDGPGMAAILGGHIQMYGTTGNAFPHVKAGKLRVLLQMSGKPQPGVDHMAKLYPDAPLAIANLHMGVYGRKGIPEPVLKKLHDAFYKASIENPLFRETCEKMFMQPDYQAPADVYKDIIETTEIFRTIFPGALK